MAPAVKEARRISEAWEILLTFIDEPEAPIPATLQSLCQLLGYEAFSQDAPFWTNMMAAIKKRDTVADRKVVYNILRDIFVSGVDKGKLSFHLH